ncbi:MAG: hypothetical protein ACRELD_00565 [Longimicrobiales bacterium]
MVQRSVATLYSHLVTRPTGQALRLGIETQIGEVGAPCLSILDFRQVVILDYSCADEAVAKLLQRYSRVDSPADVYFVARGIGERHLETIDAVLSRHDLALVAETEVQGMALLGPVPAPLRDAWTALERLTRADALTLGRELRVGSADAARSLRELVSRRVAIPGAGPEEPCLALSSLLPSA